MQTITYTCDRCKKTREFDIQKGGPPFTTVIISNVTKFELCPECEKAAVAFITNKS